MKQTYLGPGVYLTLYDQRIALRSRIQEVNYITRSDFIKDVLPRSYTAQFPDVDLVITRLKEDHALSGDCHWAEILPESLDSKAKRYAHLVEIVSSISNAATALPESDWVPPHLEYVNNGNLTPSSGLRSSSSRPDGFFVLKNRDKAEKVRWFDIAVVAEFKKDNNANAVVDVSTPLDCQHERPTYVVASENVDKMLWGMNQLMRDDPCRDFVYGFSIEDTSMKMWYCDRSNTVVSDEFDIHTVRSLSSSQFPC